jgi:hypothetical protein
MGGFVRRALALTIALALVASGTAWRQCMAMNLASGPAAGASQSAPDEQAHGHHAVHDQDAAHGHQTADLPTDPTTNEHACLKCCSACTFASALPPFADGAAIFTVTAVEFSRVESYRRGAEILVDPGIPKTIT